MQIKEFEAASGLKRSTVRFYESHGILSPTVGKNGYRHYGQDQVEAAKLAKVLQFLGFSVREIANVNVAWREGNLTQKEKLTVLREKMRECELKRDQLTALIQHLRALEVWIENGERASKPELNPST